MRWVSNFIEISDELLACVFCLHLLQSHRLHQAAFPAAMGPELWNVNFSDYKLKTDFLY